MVPWIGSWDRKRTLDLKQQQQHTSENLSKAWTLVTDAAYVPVNNMGAGGGGIQSNPVLSL